MIHIALVSLLIVCFQSSNGTEWQFTSAKDAAVLTDQITEPFVVTDLTYSAGVPLSHKEFQYLTDLHSGRQIDGADLARAIRHLFQKNVFDMITLSLDEYKEGKKVHFELKGFWRLEKIKLSGVWVGKEWYKQFYLMEPGDLFDADKHLHSLQKMQDACKQDGFFNVTTKSSFIHNQKTKGVTVNAEISRGGRFAIRNIAVVLKGNYLMSSHERAALERQIYKKLTRNILHTKYAKRLIEQQAKMLKQFLAHKGFLHIAIEIQEQLFKKRNAVHVKWIIQLHKKREFIFFGNRFFSSSELLEKVLQFGRSAFIVPASILAHEVKRAYQDKGFWQVDIDAKDEEGRSFFVIKEGQRAVIRNIAFVGVDQLHERRLRKRCFSKLKRHAVFDQTLLDQSFELLTDQYLKQGFLDFALTHHEFIREKDGPNYTLHITVHEGEQRKIKGVAIPGYEQFAQQGPFASVSSVKLPVPYTMAMIHEHKHFLSEQLHKKGYLFPSLQHELSKEDDAYRIIWHIDAGHQIRFGKTILQAETDLPFEAITRELYYREGDVWDGEKLKQSFAQLKGRNLFDSISFTPLSLNDNDATRDILLKVHKDDPFELRIRAGFEFQYIRQYQTFAGIAYKVGGTFMVKNPTNHGDLFRFDADVARSHREVRMKYLYPWVCAVPLDGLIDAYAIKYEQPGFIGNKKNLYTLYQNGFLVGLRHKNTYLDAGLNIGFEVGRTTFSDDDLQTRATAIRLARAINFDARLLDRRIPYIFFEPVLMVDLLDNNLYPTKGTFTLLSCKGMFPTDERFTQAYFVKLLVEHSWFMPLQDIIAAFRFRFGHIFHRAFCEIMPNERFYLGGGNSVRSYATDLAPPTSEFIDDEGKKHAVPRGGKTMLNVNAELRIPVAKKAGIVLFQDLGLLCGNSFADFRAHTMVAGTGFGLRFHTPIGPLRFDIGWKWKRERPDERGFNWVLTFGQAF